MYFAPGVPPVEYYLEYVTDALKGALLDHSGTGYSTIEKRLCQALTLARISHRRTHYFGPGSCADLWVEGIEIEIGSDEQQARRALMARIQRNLEQPAVRALIVVLGSDVELPSNLNGRRIVRLNLACG